jgi:hypothetical protein
MVSADGDMPVGGSGKGRGKSGPSGKKPEKRNRKPQKAEAKAEQLPQTQAPELAQALTDAPIAPVESAPAETAVIDVAAVAPVESSSIEPEAIDIAPIEPIVPVQRAPAPAPVSYQAITNAYGDYTRKSIEQTSSFFEQLAGVRSFNKAFELQTEYASRGRSASCTAN